MYVYIYVHGLAVVSLSRPNLQNLNGKSCVQQAFKIAVHQHVQ